jgi:phage shock protein A
MEQKLSNRLSALAEKAQETDDDLRYFGAKGRTNADREQLAIELVNALTTLSARVEALETHNSDAYSIVIDLAASLAAAISLLEKGGKAAKKAAPSDKMFDQMLRDYKKSLDRARQALAGDDHG